jgi:hypothetical protein
MVATLSLLRPLHMSRVPSALLPLVAPVQAAHLRFIGRQLPRDSVALERALRPLLLPREDWADVESFSHNNRFLGWLRSLYLESLASTRSRLPAVEETLAPDALPTMAELKQTFGLTHPDGRLPMPYEQRAAARADAGPAARPAGSTAGVDLGEVLHAAGGLVRGHGPFNVWCERHGVYEALTTELVGALADYIVGRLPALARGSSEPARLLEVGAGSGMLSRHLAAALAARCPDQPPTLVACDNFSQRLPVQRDAGVRKLSYRAALKEVRPQLVLCSWMPMRADWTAAFREAESVHEYVLLGEAFDGSCGHNWATWGNELAFEPPLAGGPLGFLSGGADIDAGTDNPRMMSRPHEADGWTATEVREVSRWMLSRFAADEGDAGAAEDGYTTSAVSFRRDESDAQRLRRARGGAAELELAQSRAMRGGGARRGRRSGRGSKPKLRRGRGR